MHYNTAIAISMVRETKKDNRRSAWMDNVKEDMEAKKINLQQATALVWDRNKWKCEIAASASLKNDVKETKRQW